MKKVRCYVKRNMSHIAPVETPLWELPILRAIHGREQIEELGVIEVDQATPYLLAEADRLTKRYGKDEETGVPYFIKVYGAEDVGLERLSKAIAEACGEVPELENVIEQTVDFENFEHASKGPGKKKAAAAA